MSRPHPLQSVLGTFRAFARAVAPMAADFDTSAWTAAEANVAQALVDKPEKLVRQLVLFLRLVDVLALARFGRRFERLLPHQAVRLLAGLERSPLLLIRRGTWGLRTLGFIAVYAQPAVARALGYSADPAGWDAPDVCTAPWTHRDGAAGAESEVLDMLASAAAE